ncbi:MAG: phosphate ABC transporter permease subunit PstC [Lentisphaeria bacterium]
MDKGFKIFCLSCASLAGVLFLGFLLMLAYNSLPVWQEFGWRFLISSEWNPVEEIYGAWPSLLGTLSTTIIALALALPLAFVSALYLAEAPAMLSRILSQGIDLLAAIPSVIYGMWGLFILVPIMQNQVQPFLIDRMHLSAWPLIGRFFSEYFNGFGILTAGLILAIMILPYICAIMRDIFKMTPPLLREAAFGAGCTRWETAKDIVMKHSASALLGGVFIGLGRALGETMAVLFVIGNMMTKPTGFFDSGTTIAATLANNFAEADGLQRSTLFALGLLLLLLSFAIQVLAQHFLQITACHRGEKN